MSFKYTNLAMSEWLDVAFKLFHIQFRDDKYSNETSVTQQADFIK